MAARHASTATLRTSSANSSLNVAKPMDAVVVGLVSEAKTAQSHSVDRCRKAKTGHQEAARRNASAMKAGVASTATSVKQTTRVTL